MITIAGKKYKVTENLGYVSDRGQYAKAIETPDGERIAVKDPGGYWHFSKPRIGVMGRPTGQGVV